MKCEKCDVEMLPEDSHTHSGKTLCEDCYLDIVAAPKTCDPWAVYSAKKTVAQDTTLTAEQQQILDLLKTRGPLSLERICTDLDISEDEFRHNFATLRHMELAKGCKMGNRVCFMLFDG